MTERNEALEEKYRFGGCYPMAVALAELLDWRIEALVVEHRPQRSVDRWLTQVVHAYVVAPDGRPFDAGGPLDLDELRYVMLSPERCGRVWRNARTESFDDADTFLRGLYEIAGEEETEARTFMTSMAEGAEKVAR